MNTLQADHPIVVTLTNHMAPCRVVRVLYADEFDFEGDPILRLRVVVDETGPDVDPIKAFTATRLVRQVMEQQNDLRFPLLTYPTNKEMSELAA